MATRVAVAVSPSTRRRRGRGFVPTDIAGCILWLPPNPAAMTFNGANVVTWWDQSGSGRDVTQGAVPNQPLYSAAGGPTGGPCVDFSTSVIDYLQGVWVQGQPMHMFIITMPDAAGAANKFVADGSALNSQRIVVSPLATDIAAGTGIDLVVNGVAAAAWHRIESLFNGAASTLVVDAASTAGDMGGGVSNGLTLGVAGNGATWNSASKVAEVVQYSAAITGANLAALRAYFLAGYGL